MAIISRICIKRPFYDLFVFLFFLLCRVALLARGTMKSPWYILQVIVLLIILATCFSLTNAQGGCCSKIRDCNIPAGCFCPLKKAVCSGGANRHFISGKRSDIRWNYPNRAGDDWDEYKYLMRQDKHTDRLDKHTLD